MIAPEWLREAPIPPPQVPPARAKYNKTRITGLVLIVGLACYGGREAVSWLVCGIVRIMEVDQPPRPIGHDLTDIFREADGR